MFLRMSPCLPDRGLMEIKAGEPAFRIGLGHQQGRKADTAPHVRYPCAAAKPRFHSIQRRNPSLNDVVDVSRPQKCPRCTEQAAGMIAPADARAMAETFLDLGFRFDHRRRKLECSGKVDWAGPVDEDH